MKGGAVMSGAMKGGVVKGGVVKGGAMKGGALKANWGSPAMKSEFGKGATSPCSVGLSVDIVYRGQRLGDRQILAR